MKKSIPLTTLITLPEVQEFILKHSSEDVRELVLKYGSKVSFDLAAVAQQIELRQKTKKKIKEFITPYTLLLPKLYEQSTHEEVAKYKATFIQGETLLDATTGLGIDCFYIGKNFKHVTCLESNTQHANILKHNFDQLDFNPEIKKTSLEEFILINKKEFDVIYIDPDRRPDSKREYFDIGQCTPNVLALKSHLIQTAKETWIKLSPMMDIHSIVQNFKPNIFEVHCIALHNEMKEILICLKKGGQLVKYTATNITTSATFSFSSSEIETKLTSSDPLNYFFEPNVALVKSKLCFEYCKMEGMSILYPNGYYFTMNKVSTHLQGRFFEIIKILPYKKEMHFEFIKQNKVTKANISCRNFFWKPEEVKKLLKLSDGGEWYLFCYNDKEKKPVGVWCKKVTIV